MLKESEIRKIVESVIKNTSLSENDPTVRKQQSDDTSVPRDGDESVLEDLMDHDLYEWCLVPEPENPEGMKKLKASTPARICSWRSGPRLKVDSWLRFRADHAKARDAVWHEISSSVMEDLGVVCVQSQACEKEQYLTRPDLGRQLNDQARQKIVTECTKKAQIQLVVTDGLSSFAIEENASDFIQAFKETIKSFGLSIGETIFVKFGRVAVMDQIGDLLDPEVIVELVGERPGLVTAASMSAYLCFRPSNETIESDRTLVANIHSGGLPAVEAGAHVAGLAKKILEAKESGMKIKD